MAVALRTGEERTVAMWEFKHENFAGKFEVLLGRALSSEQVTQRGKTRPILFNLELRNEEWGVTVEVGSQADLDLDANEETIEREIAVQLDALIERALREVEPLRAAQEDERQAEKQIEHILDVWQTKRPESLARRHQGMSQPRQ